MGTLAVPTPTTAWSSADMTAATSAMAASAAEVSAATITSADSSAAQVDAGRDIRKIAARAGHDA